MLDDLVDRFCLLTGFQADPHGIMHDYDGDYDGNCENRRVPSADPAGGDSHTGYSRGVAAGHAAVSKEPLKHEFPVNDSVDDDFQKLGNPPRCNTCDQYMVG